MVYLHRSLCITIVWWSFYIKIFREVWWLIGSKISIRVQVCVDVWCRWFQFVAISLNIWTWIAYTILILDTNTETIVFEWYQISNFTCATSNTCSYRNPISFWQFQHLNLIRHRYTGWNWDWRFPTECQAAIWHFCDNGTISQWSWSSSFLILIKVWIKITMCRLVSRLKG